MRTGNVHYYKLATQVISGEKTLDQVKQMFRSNLTMYWTWYHQYYTPLKVISDRQKQLDRLMYFNIYSTTALNMCTQQIKEITSITEEMIQSKGLTLEQYVSQNEGRARATIFKAMPEYIEDGMKLYHESPDWVNGTQEFTKEWNQLTALYKKNILSTRAVWSIIGAIL